MAGVYGNPYKSIRLRRGLRADIPTLNDGEAGFCTDTGEVAVGFEGVNYFIGASSSLWSAHGSVSVPTIIVPSVGLADFSATQFKQAHLIKGEVGNGGVLVTAPIPIALGDTFGKEVRLVGMHATDFPIFQWIDGVLQTNGTWSARKGSSLSLMCLGAGEAWQEVGRTEA